MKKKTIAVCTALFGLLVIQNGVGQPLHAEDQSAAEATDVSVLELPEETVPSSTESMEVPMSSEEGTVPSTVPSEEVPATSSEDSQETVSSAPVESETTPTSSESSTSQSTEASTAPSETSTPTETSESTTPSSEPTSSSTSNVSSSSKEPTATTPSSTETSTEAVADEEPEKDKKPAASSSPAKQEQSVALPANTQSETFNKERLPESAVSQLLSEINGTTLDDSLRVSEVAETDLKGFELPLLKTFTDKSKAILIYEGIKQVGLFELSNEKNEDGKKIPLESTEVLINTLLENLFDQSLKTSHKEEIPREEKQAGDLLYHQGKLLGLYLGGDHYVTVGEPTTKEIEEHSELANQKVAKIGLLSKEKFADESLTVQRLAENKLTTYGKEVEKAYPASMDFSENAQTQTFIQAIAKSAQKLGLDYDVFASVMIAQAILESGSGTSALSSAPNYNLFGVKGSYQGSSVSFATQEDRGNGELYTIQAAFRKYPSYAQSLGDYVSLLRGGIQGNELFYQDTWRSTAKNYLRAADALTGKYATDTTYNQKISSLIAAYHLTQYDQTLSASTTSTSSIMVGKEKIPETYRKEMTYPDYDGKNYNVSGSYPVGQCTWYAYNRVAQLGKSVDDYMGNGGEWGATAKRLGYETSQVPKAGWLISFTPGTAGSDPNYGHVAFVEAVTDEGILISEGNVVGGTKISYRVIGNDLAYSELVTYVEPR